MLQLIEKSTLGAFESLVNVAKLGGTETVGEGQFQMLRLTWVQMLRLGSVFFVRIIFIFECMRCAWETSCNSSDLNGCDGTRTWDQNGSVDAYKEDRHPVS